MQQSPAISHAFNYVCQILHCNKSAEQYQLLYIEKVKLRKIGTEHTQLSGVLINQNNKSIELPNLKLSFGKETDQEEIIFTPQQYLVENLRGIQRIPTNTPFRFQVELNKSKKPSKLSIRNCPPLICKKVKKIKKNAVNLLTFS